MPLLTCNQQVQFETTNGVTGQIAGRTELRSATETATPFLHRSQQKQTAQKTLQYIKTCAGSRTLQKVCSVSELAQVSNIAQNSLQYLRDFAGSQTLHKKALQCLKTCRGSRTLHKVCAVSQNLSKFSDTAQKKFAVSQNLLLRNYTTISTEPKQVIRHCYIGFSNDLVLSIGLLIKIYLWELFFKINNMIGNTEKNPNI